MSEAKGKSKAKPRKPKEDPNPDNPRLSTPASAEDKVADPEAGSGLLKTNKEGWPPQTVCRLRADCVQTA